MSWCSRLRSAATVGALALASGAGPASQPAGCAPLPRPVCEVRDDRITEASGLAASRRHPGLYYVHNDSGDSARVFLLDRTGRTRLTVTLTGVAAVDFEDLALAPGVAPGTFDVCVADCGDNNARRSEIVIYRFPEPDLPAEPDTIAVTPTAFRWRYADGPADVEALAVLPQTGEAFLLTKRSDARTFVYKAAAPWAAFATLPRVAIVDLPAPTGLPGMVTAADIAPDGRRLAVRTYAGGWEWRLPEDMPGSAFERIFERRPAPLVLAAETQGEALGYAADGRSLLTVSEGLHPTVFEVARAAATQPTTATVPAESRPR